MECFKENDCFSLAMREDLKWSCDLAAAPQAPVSAPRRRPVCVVAASPELTWRPSLQLSQPLLLCLDWGATFFIFLSTAPGKVSTRAAGPRWKPTFIFFNSVATRFSLRPQSRQPNFLWKKSRYVIFFNKTKKSPYVLVLTVQKTRHEFNKEQNWINPGWQIILSIFDSSDKQKERYQLEFSAE